MNAITTLFYTNNAIEKTAANTIIVTNMQCATERWSAIPSSYSEHRVRMGPGKPGKSWNFILAFSRPGKSWKKATGPGKFWKSVKLNYRLKMPAFESLNMVANSHYQPS